MGSHRHRTGFDDNEWTVRGHLTHRVVDQPGGVSRSCVRTESALPLWSDELGLNGKADVVEFRGRDAYPVEYKAGKRVERPAVLQLAAQAVCLEEMFGIAVPVGALYLAALRERVPVEISMSIRDDLARTIDQLRLAYSEAKLGDSVDDKRCKLCSLQDRCVPKLVKHRQSVAMLAASTYRL